MTFPDLVGDLKARMPNLRGRLLPNQSLAELTWFRVGGPAQVLFMPEDELDLADFLAHLPGEIPVCVIGLGSNLIVRDGGVPGIVIRLGRGFSNGDMDYSYRHCGAPDDIVFTEALFQGASGNPADIAVEMEKITESREATQPIKSRTGGSTFKNPPGHKAWQLIDAAGCRGLRIGDAQVSPMHCNFLINLGGATAADIETLGETVRRRVKEHSGVDLEWEIKRIGVA